MYDLFINWNFLHQFVEVFGFNLAVIDERKKSMQKAGSLFYPSNGRFVALMVPPRLFFPELSENVTQYVRKLGSEIVMIVNIIIQFFQIHPCQ
jgi:hypothetical protein